MKPIVLLGDFISSVYRTHLNCLWSAQFSLDSSLHHGGTVGWVRDKKRWYPLAYIGEGGREGEEGGEWNEGGKS